MMEKRVPKSGGGPQLQRRTEGTSISTADDNLLLMCTESYSCNSPRSGKRTVLYGFPKNVKIFMVDFGGNLRYVSMMIRDLILNLMLSYEVVVPTVK